MLLRLRPSYHDRLDPPAGFLTGGEIEFFDTELLLGKRGLKFGSFRVVSVQAVVPRDLAFNPISWQASGGARKLDLQARSAIPGGRTGGYALLKAPEEITFGEVLRLIDGPLALLPCLSKIAYRRCEDCRDETNCEIRRVFARVADATRQVLDSTTLADAVDSDLEVLDA